MNARCAPCIPTQVAGMSFNRRNLFLLGCASLANMFGFIAVCIIQVFCAYAKIFYGTFLQHKNKTALMGAFLHIKTANCANGLDLW